MPQEFTALKKLFHLPDKIVHRVRHHGLMNMLLWCVYQVSWRLRERRLGIVTGEFSHKFRQRDEGECVAYEPIGYKCFDLIMEQLPIDPGVDGFVDYGCGKGRAVVLAATYPFAKVIGVERRKELTEIARDNVERARRHITCPDVQIANVDARAWAVPHDITIAFLFNPFGGDILDNVIARIHESLTEYPRPFRLVYVLPKGQHDPFAELAWLKRDREISTGFWDHVTCALYEFQPTHAALGRVAESELA